MFINVVYMTDVAAFHVLYMSVSGAGSGASFEQCIEKQMKLHQVQCTFNISLYVQHIAQYT